MNVLIVDDFLVERSRSQKVELLAKTFDHSKKQILFRVSYAYSRKVRWKYVFSVNSRTFLWDHKSQIQVPKDEI